MNINHMVEKGQKRYAFRLNYSVACFSLLLETTPLFCAEKCLGYKAYIIVSEIGSNCGEDDHLLQISNRDIIGFTEIF